MTTRAKPKPMRPTPRTVERILDDEWLDYVRENETKYRIYARDFFRERAAPIRNRLFPSPSKPKRSGREERRK